MERSFVVSVVGTDPRAASLVRSAHTIGVRSVRSVEVHDLWFINDADATFDPTLLIDTALQFGEFEAPSTELPSTAQTDTGQSDPGQSDAGQSDAGQSDAGQSDRWVIETALLPGVTDPIAEALERAAELQGSPNVRAASGRRYVVTGPTSASEVDLLIRRLLANSVIERAAIGRVTPGFADGNATPPVVEHVAITALSNTELLALSAERGLALDLQQLEVVRNFFQNEKREPTDAELETIAQTWSEHCAHTTFRADITWADGTPVVPLLKQLRNCTDAINAPFVKSSFVGNAGIVAFDEAVDIAVKAETHNHPSAVEPFGGANTGVGGVIRDVLGVGARPIAVTDVLCFGPADLPAEELPEGVLHPERIRDGVIAGVADYGNKLGLPTVAGAIVHDPGYTANPLVFAGCVGVRPATRSVRGAKTGDRIIALGGRTGRDGIRGATFSSMTMDATTGDVAGASVQIGDPVTERLLVDLIDEAFDAGFVTDITDCGAGGFSSAVGEMAEVLGADVQLDAAPRKYPGLAPWEVWLSEAQERMVIAVDPANLQSLSALCFSHGVEWCDLGSFRSDGRLRVFAGEQSVVDLPAAFLHDGRPTRHLVAERADVAPPSSSREVPDNQTAILQLLAHPSLRSNEDVVRGFDHEILGHTVGRPYLGAADDGPADAAVIVPLGSVSGGALAIGIGVNCRFGDLDAQAMAESVVDEAIRNVVAVGADPTKICLLDNFSWGNPRRPSTLGQLVDAVTGCCEAATRFAAPFVSGKDSLNNEYAGSDGQRHAVPPTLVITAFGMMPSADCRVTSDLKAPGNVLVVVGKTRDELRGSHLDAVLGIDGPGTVPQVDPGAPARYVAIHQAILDGLVVSAHDCAEGGLAVALVEMAMGGRLGIETNLDGVHADPVVAMFSESNSRLVLEVAPDNLSLLMSRFESDDVTVVGTVSHEAEIFGLRLDTLLHAWRGHVTNGSSVQGSSEQSSSAHISSVHGSTTEGSR